MDFSSPHMPYIMGAYIFAGGILLLLTILTLRADRIIRRQLEKYQQTQRNADEAEA